MSQRLLEHPDVTIRGDDLLSSIGGTPLIRLHRVTHDLPSGVEVCAKAEHLNPGGSVKDRAARAMIVEGERRGQLHPGKIILDATSGNTGIAYAMIGAARGYRVKLCLPKNASFERKRILRIYGAELIETDPAQGTDGAQLRAREMVAGEPEKYFYRINTTMMLTGERIMKGRPPKSGNKRVAASRTSSPGWELRERSRASHAG